MDILDDSTASDGCGLCGMRRLHGAEEVQEHQIEVPCELHDVMCICMVPGCRPGAAADIWCFERLLIASTC